MSTHTIDINSLPDEISTSAKAWRFSEGQICTGRDIDGTLETRPAIVGYLKRVGIHEGETKEGQIYAKIEAVIETKDGDVSVGASLKGATNGGKPTYGSCISFAEGLLDCEKGELIQVKASQASKPNQYGKKATYAQVYKVKSATSAERTKAYPYPADTPYGDAMIEILCEALRAHSAWGERPRKATEDEEVAAWDGFRDALAAKGWPAMQDAQSEYLKIASKTAKKEFSGLADVPAEIWAAMMEVVRTADKMPAAIGAISDKLKMASSDEDDPFA